jgi:5-methylcytosine-specific restriction endonuclease McrA
MSKKETEKLHALFRQLWDQREDAEGCCYCYETGTRMEGWRFRGNTMCYDHVLPKSKYPQYKFEPWNIIILLPEVHTQKTHDIDKTPRVRGLRDKLLEDINKEAHDTSAEG